MLSKFSMAVCWYNTNEPLFSLDEAEHEFASSAFLRIHKSYLINGDHILQMSNYKVLLDTGMTLKGSRKYFSKAKLEFYRGR